MASRIRDARGDDSGFTLVELVITGLLTVLVLSVVTGLFVSMTTTESSVRTVTTATTAGQFVAGSIERGARNSSTMAVTTPATGDLLLQARTVGSAATAVWGCSAWYFSAADQTIRYKTSTAQIPTPTAASQRSWTLLSGGVSAVAGGPVFAVANTASGQTLALSFQESAGKSAPVVFQSSSSNQIVTDSFGGPASCF